MVYKRVPKWGKARFRCGIKFHPVLYWTHPYHKSFLSLLSPHSGAPVPLDLVYESKLVTVLARQWNELSELGISQLLPVQPFRLPRIR
jgi:hypothetical protein